MNAASLKFLFAALVKASFLDGLPCRDFAGAVFLPKQSRKRKEYKSKDSRKEIYFKKNMSGIH